MKSGSSIFVAGHRGLVGSAVIRVLRRAGYQNLLLRDRNDLDLSDRSSVTKFFESEHPEFVVLAAARVGGIHANMAFPAEFLEANLAIQDNVIQACRRCGVRRLIFLGSSCVYPRDCPQPIQEEALLSGPLEISNRPYAMAKITGIEQCWVSNRQYNTRFIALLPCNLYGPGDNYHENHSHVLPALLRRLYEARLKGDSECVIWGTGSPQREFMISDDCADACLFLLQMPDSQFDSILSLDGPPILNVGTGEEVSIRELAGMIAEVVGFEGELLFDTTRPDGTPRKVLDCSRMHKLGWSARTRLRDGLQRTFEDVRTSLESTIQRGSVAGDR